MIQNYKGRKAMQKARSLLLFEIRRRELYVQGHTLNGIDLERYIKARNVPSWTFRKFGVINKQKATISSLRLTKIPPCMNLNLWGRRSH